MNDPIKSNVFEGVTGADAMRLFAALTANAPEALIGIASSLVAARDVRWLQVLLESGIAGRVGEQLQRDRVKLFDALLGLEADGAPALVADLVSGWERALGITRDDLQAALPTVKDLAIMRAYARRGATPNASAPGYGASDTALSSVTAAFRIDVARAMLDLLAERDEIPLHAVAGAGDESTISYFDALLGSHFGRVAGDLVSEYLCTRDLSDRWTSAIAHSLKTFRPPAGDNTKVMDDVYYRLLSVAKFDTPQDLLKEIVSRGAFLSFSLVAFTNQPVKLHILEKICLLGIDPDEIPSAMHTAGVPVNTCTMLHVATFAQNVPAVQILLRAGADPMRVVEPRTDRPAVHSEIGRNAFQIAQAAPTSPEADEVRRVLDAWRARQAVRTIASAAHQVASERP